MERLEFAAFYQQNRLKTDLFPYFQDYIVDIVANLEANEQRRTTVSETVVAPPSPRSNFSFCPHPDKEELILFGGEFYNGQTLTVFNELYFYNIPKNEWKLVMAPGGPGPRSAHQMVSVASDGGQLWVRPSFRQRIFHHIQTFDLFCSSLVVSIRLHRKCNFITIEICGFFELPHVNGRKSSHKPVHHHEVAIE